MQPKISVIIPVYGVEQYIERCAVSLFEQTLSDIEFIFIDDCTPDRSIEILKQVVAKYKNRIIQNGWTVRIEKLPQNSGQAAVRRQGILWAKGEYVIFCDSDDWVDHEMYRILYEKAKEGDCDMVRCNFVRTDGIKQRLCRQIPIEAYDDPMSLLSYALLGYSLTSTCDKIFRRRLFDNAITYPIHNMQEDAAYVIQLLYFCKRCAFVPYMGYYYFDNTSSISKHQSTESFMKRLDDVRSNADLIFAFLEGKKLSQRYREEIQVHKLSVRNHILNLLIKFKYVRLWNSIYPEINGLILFNKKASFENKVYYIMARLYIFSILLKLWNIKKILL